MNVSQGDRAWIIDSVDGLNVGKIVRVRKYQGEHPRLGAIWHVRSEGTDLITEYGAVGPECDCADAWLKRIPPDNPDPVGEDVSTPIEETL